MWQELFRFGLITVFVLVFTYRIHQGFRNGRLLDEKVKTERERRLQMWRNLRG